MHRLNRLSESSSPYLLQHAGNPVDWYPWGEEALERARLEDRPILLSIGYAACHWCHVMERECFENPTIAAQMNEHFVCIKVDREERPDLDSIYMSAVQAMTGQGGWPMTVFLTPNTSPFFAGTYFPPEDRHGQPGLPRLLTAVHEAWTLRRSEIEEQGKDLAAQLRQGNEPAAVAPGQLLTNQVLDAAYTRAAQQFDRTHGGFGRAPKFPQPSGLEFLLTYHARTSRQEPLAMVERTLQKMGLGGIYDQLGGGFHRYSTDEKWLVPHFEKMLYDNAQLCTVYLHAHQVTGRKWYRSICEETLEYVLREMTDEHGGFYSAQDADSEGEEGRFFVWNLESVAEAVGTRDAPLVCRFYDVTEGGNWEGTSILHVKEDATDSARAVGIPLESAVSILDAARRKMLEARNARPHPLCDDKVLTAWNGLMVAAFAECGAAFQREDFVRAAAANAQFVLDHMTFTDAKGRLRLFRTWRDGRASLNGYLEDYALYGEGLLRLYEATFDARWFLAAQQLADTMIAEFWDQEGSGFFSTSTDHEVLLHRPKVWDDNAVPGGNSSAAGLLLRLSALTGSAEYRDRAASVLRRSTALLEAYPLGFTRMLCVLDSYVGGIREVALAGDIDSPEMQEMLAAVRKGYRPDIVMAAGTKDDPVPLLAGRDTVGSAVTAYVCANFTCQRPVTTPEELVAQLKAGRSSI